MLIKKITIRFLGIFLFIFQFVGTPVQAQDLKECLLFSRYINGNWQVWMKVLDSDREYQITYSSIDKRMPKFNKTARELIYRSANSELVKLSLDSAKEEQILNKFGFIMDQNFSSDGKQIAFARLRSDKLDDSDIWTVNRDGSDQKSLTNEEGIQFNPVWSPDDKTIAFVSRAEKWGRNFAIWTMDSHGGNYQQITKGINEDLLPSFSPDGQTIVYSSNENRDYDIWTVDLNTRKCMKLTDHKGLDTSPVYSADGFFIYYASFEAKFLQIWRMDKAGSNSMQITFQENDAQDPWCGLIPVESIEKLIKMHERKKE